MDELTKAIASFSSDIQGDQLARNAFTRECAEDALALL